MNLYCIIKLATEISLFSLQIIIIIIIIIIDLAISWSARVAKS